MSGDTSITVRPADAVAWEDVAAVFGVRGEAGRCLCQRVRWPHRVWHEMPRAERQARLREQAAAGGGLVAYLGEEPAGWCAVGPRPGFGRLMQAQTTVPWAGRSEDRADAGVWAIGCLVSRAGFRRRGVMRAMVQAAVGFARAGGARALEGYPMVREVGREVPWGEMSVGAESAFAAAGFEVASRPAPRRVVMRVEFGAGG
jgi:GNAT superfamily N-acetyltransferase